MFVVIEHHSRRLIHHNVTSHPSAAWTLQQLRDVVGYADRCRFLIHDRDCIFANQLASRHRRGEAYAVHGESILGGLHHEYSLVVAGA